ncbi:MAG: hypothetical protein CMI23_12335 [Opitutae bacterium]|nr:hypothetical protein [Opitutae bacterium]|tara:strand:- start:80 stop:862 length:783 start_codon:yes stop_codon:yes gene_type:complete
MDTIAFWLPILFLFLSALVGTILQRRACDPCLKKIDGREVIFFDLNGKLTHGILSVFANGIELIFFSDQKDDLKSVYSTILHPHEVDKISMILCPAPRHDTRAGVIWEKELLRIQQPSILDLSVRHILSFYNMLRDAFSQALNSIVGALSKSSKISEVKNADKSIKDISRELNDLVPNAWEPILEKYRGHKIKVERKTPDGNVYEDGILEDYSSKYLLVRKVSKTNQDIMDFAEKRKKISEQFDVLYSRNSALVRMALKD